MEKNCHAHTNGMRFIARDSDGQIILGEDYYSLGGGFIARGDEPERDSQSGEPPYPFTSGAELLAIAEKESLTIAELVEKNERQWRSEDEIRHGLMNIWSAMQACVERGLRTDGVLPGHDGSDPTRGETTQKDAGARRTNQSRRYGLGQRIRNCGERRKCGWRPGSDFANEWRCRHHPGGAALL